MCAERNAHSARRSRSRAKGATTSPDYTGVPTAAFTIPEPARVGLVEQEPETRAGTFELHREGLQDGALVAIDPGSTRTRGPGALHRGAL